MYLQRCMGYSQKRNVKILNRNKSDQNSRNGMCKDEILINRMPMIKNTNDKKGCE